MIEPSRREELAAFYRQHIEKQILPFWHRAIDREFGGVFTCYSNSGEELVSTDKYTWSQGRYLWLWSKIVPMIRKGLISGDEAPYLEQLERTATFIESHAFLESGSCAFLLNREGEKREPISGSGYDTSIFADCFVVLGLSEYAGLSGDAKRLETALSLYRHIRHRLESGEVRSEPYPVPEGYRTHSFPMILLNVAQSVWRASAALNRKKEAEEIHDHCRIYMNEIMERFRKGDRIVELLPEREELEDTLLARHVNPGHALESMWFVMHTARDNGEEKIIRQAADVIHGAIRRGWDEQYGGLFRFVDSDGREPAGRPGSPPSRQEELITDTWDLKLWWPHSEALYSTLLAYELTGDERMIDHYHRMETYVFNTFPHPDPEVGEWIQIRDRKGEPLEKVVALPVKDPFHILRNLLLILELLKR